ncbi:uncharacterized protein LOC120113034, partial [Phoenix dactylifera]|uniref:Uncharacterized protein LOC120113034 n=1 Tax=Phoenix dactylifera TaxID=42345 RepID=A0A8B9AV62_PHODC
QATNRPPLFNGTNYTYWKTRMRIFIQAQDYALWRVIVKGPQEPSHMVNGIQVPKPEEDWNENDDRMAQLNSRAMNSLFCALDVNEFNRVSTCSSAKKIWDRLEVTHEGTNQVKESKVNILVHKYELFKMKPNETITCMFTRFTDIINGLKSLGKSYTNPELVSKILRSLPKAWEAKVTLDSGCSRHMTGDKSLFVTLKSKEGGVVTFGDNAKGQIIGVGKISISPSSFIDNVLLVNGLKHNLLSISQFCDKGFKVSFESSLCIISSPIDNEIILTGHRHGNVYMVDLDDLTMKDGQCLVAMSPKVNETSWLWHRRLGHASMDLVSKLITKDLVKGLPKIDFEKNKICAACQLGKQTRSSFKSKNIVSTTKPLELIHMDLFGPTRTASLGGKKFGLVIVDDFSRFTWVSFLAHKDESLPAFIKFHNRVSNELNLKLKAIRSDHGTEFENQHFEKFCDENGINHNFSAPRTPQQNGVVERKNRTLADMARTMLCESDLPKYFWAEAINTACHILNRALVRSILKKTPYELIKGKKPNISYFHVFGCRCFILNNGKDNLSKFSAKSDEGIFLGYSSSSRAYRVFNKRTLVVEEFIHVVFDELEAIRLLLAYACFMDFKLYQMDVKSAFLNGYIMEEVYVGQPPGFENHLHPDYVYKLHKALYGLKQAPRAWYERLSNFLIENKFKRGNVDKTLFIKRKGNDLLLVQIYVDDIIFGATNDSLCQEFAKLMQGEFEMSMMGELNFFLGLQIKQSEEGIFISQSKYVKEMLEKFKMKDAKEISTPMGSSCKLDKDEKGKSIDCKLYRGMIGSLLYLTTSRPDILFSVCMCARYQACPKESHLQAVKRIFRYLVGTSNVGLWYSKQSDINLIAYSDADFAGCKLDRKSTSGTCQFLGANLVSWFSKKQNSVALSTAETEYIAAGSCCAQVLWIKQQLEDFGIKMDNIPIKCDNTSAINLTKNPVQHSKSKHIEIRHHFIRDHVLKNDVMIEYVCTENQLADIFTKPLCKD